jgi:hypothetical protein
MPAWRSALDKQKEHFVFLYLYQISEDKKEVVSLSQFRRSINNALTKLSLKWQTVSNCQLRANEEDDSTIVV